VDETTLQLLAWCAAFWVAVLGFVARQSLPRFGTRFLVGLALGAALAHLGWAALHPSVFRAQPLALLDPSLGYTVLAVPLGLLLTAPWRARPARRGAYLAAAFASLPAALAVARLGCLAVGCCHGRPTQLPWSLTIGDGIAVHATPLFEIAGLAVLFLLVRRLPDGWIPTAVLCGIGLIRIVVEPLRAEPPLGSPAVPASVLAAIWIAVGVALSPTSKQARALISNLRRGRLKRDHRGIVRPNHCRAGARSWSSRGRTRSSPAARAGSAWPRRGRFRNGAGASRW
jgi:phosphatidylglycerol:prolipoprotein diacylglycerol transferase